MSFADETRFKSFNGHREPQSQLAGTANNKKQGTAMANKTQINEEHRFKTWSLIIPLESATVTFCR